MFTHEDIIKFYQLLIHYNPASNNIGIVNKEKFKKVMKLLLKEHKNNFKVKIIINLEKTKITIIENEIEKTYILIQKPKDLKGKFFRKYV